ncbi:MAG: hypothetical protein EOQ55_28625 [Mesorhizobium sp.]|nr:hypothetical protein EOD29_27395 [Mesorhizobium sp. M1A.T.Ca.IN.004.03.1.1]RWG11361.1 MAG: hypothetical protein EOQ55_28625 [Mesorhizobium sp.]RWI97924.1 MAG: hypothetical protein EOR22_06310 [Mesorhizobium sp.]RWK29763.1 MAG: hypothetical protein EOR40_26670 [Mesorhizobium sp.]TIP16990.1 MAG: hypothetical protein E5X66_23260 [Mesorhizobium sp.]
MSNPHKLAEAFVADFRRMEYALKRSGYIRNNRKDAQADWGSFAHALGKKFFDQVVADGIAKTLIGHPPRQLLADLHWSPQSPAPLANVAELIVNGVCRVRNSYIHGEKFTGGPEGQWERDALLIHEAHAVLNRAAVQAASPSETSRGHS